MRKIILFFLLVLTFQVSAQKGTSKKPSTSSQAQTQMDKELKELESEDPEMARKIREMMKQKQSPKTVSKIAPAPKFVSPVTQVPLKQAAIPPLQAQVTDRFLWFKGKKLNDSVLITSDGALVLYGRKTNRVVIKPDPKKDPIDKIAKELAKTEQRKNELIDAMFGIKNSFFMYPLLEATLAKYDEITNDYSEALKNTFDLPVTVRPSNTGFTLHKKSGTVSYLKLHLYEDDIAAQIRKMYREVLEFKEQAPAITVPIPPAHGFDVCYTCDTAMKNKYQADTKSWNAELFRYEQELHRKAVYLLRNVDYYAAYLEKNEADKMLDDMFAVKMFLIKRLDEKITDLMEQFGNDMTRLEGVIQAVLNFKKQKRLLGAEDELDAGIVLKLKEAIQTTAFVDQQLRDKNYHVIFMLPFVLGLDRQKALMAETGEGEFSDNSGSFALELNEKLTAFNRFKLTMEMDFDVAFLDGEGKEEVKANGKMSTTSDVYVSLGVNDCKYQLYLSNVDYRKTQKDIEYSIPFKISGGTKSVKLEDDRWTTYAYSGPVDGVTIFQPCRISFCNTKTAEVTSGFDSLYVQMVRYKDENLERYADAVKNGYSIDMLGYANNMYFTPSQIQSSTEEMESIAMEWIQTMGDEEIQNPSGNIKLDKMKKEYELVLKQQEYQFKLSQLAMMPKTLVLFDARNGDHTLIDAQVDTAHKDDNVVLKKGLIKIKLMHDPLPYQMPKRKVVKNS